MNDPTTASPRLPAAPAILGDLRVADWIDVGDSDLELATDATVGDVRRSPHDVHLADDDSHDFSPAYFAGEDGRVYTAEIGVVVRPATPAEVRAAVETKKAASLDAAASRAEALDGYLSALGT